MKLNNKWVGASDETLLNRKKQCFHPDLGWYKIIKTFLFPTFFVGSILCTAGQGGKFNVIGHSEKF